jgi:uncharacterized membrane protein
LKPLDGGRIRRAIGEAEAGTTGRIGVRLIPEVTTDPLESARTQFRAANLHQHPPRNAVVFLVAPNARRFAVFGDEAIHQRVGDEFWSQLVAEMMPYFAQERSTDGLLLGIARIGEQLRAHFPSEAKV